MYVISTNNVRPGKVCMQNDIFTLLVGLRRSGKPDIIVVKDPLVIEHSFRVTINMKNNYFMQKSRCRTPRWPNCYLLQWFSTISTGDFGVTAINFIVANSWRLMAIVKFKNGHYDITHHNCKPDFWTAPFHTHRPPFLIRIMEWRPHTEPSRHGRHKIRSV